MKFLAKMHWAIQLGLASRKPESEALVAELEKIWLEDNVTKCDDRFCYLLGATNDLERTKRHFEQLNSEKKSKMILAILRGLAGTPIY